LIPWLAFTIKGLEQGWLAQCQFSVGYHVYLRYGTSVCWYLKTRLKSGPVTADLTTTVVHNSKLLINDVKPDHLLTHSLITTIYLQYEKKKNLNVDSSNSIKPINFIVYTIKINKSTQVGK